MPQPNESQLLNTFYFKSCNVKVYPSSFRGNYTIATSGQQPMFDPEAHLTTEFNLINLRGGSKQSYIKKWDGDACTLICVIGGYYFEFYNIYLDDFKDGNTVKNIYIKTKNVPLKTDDSGSGAEDPDSPRETWILDSCQDDVNVLDKDLPNNEYYFTGAYVSTSFEHASAVLTPFVFNANGELVVNASAYEPSINCGMGTTATSTETKVTSIVLGTNTNATGGNTFALGENTTAIGENSVAGGEGTTSLGSNSKAFGKGKGELSTIFSITAIDPTNKVITLNSITYAGGSERLITGNILKYEAAYSTKYLPVIAVNNNSITVSADSDISDLSIGSTVNVVLGVASGNTAVVAGVANTASGEASYAEGRLTKATGAYSHTAGQSTLASGNNAVAIGNTTKATGESSFASGQNTVASGNYSHTEGFMTTANGLKAHAEGTATRASGEASHAEGNEAEAAGDYSHAEGDMALAQGIGSHAEGINTFAVGEGSHAEGRLTWALGENSHAEGRGRVRTVTITAKNANTFTFTDATSLVVGQILGYEDNTTHIYYYCKILSIDEENNSVEVSGDYANFPASSENIEVLRGIAYGSNAHAEGHATTAVSDGAHAEGDNTVASGNYSHAEGRDSLAKANFTHAEGDATHANGQSSHTEGGNTETTSAATYAHAEGSNTIASKSAAHAEGQYTKASGIGAHAEGGTNAAGSGQTQKYTEAHGNYSHAEGQETFARGVSAHAEGINNTAASDGSHSEGYQTIAGDDANTTTRAASKYAHAEGNQTKASGEASHAEGYKTTAKGNYSHASGTGTYANNENEFVVGAYNKYAANDGNIFVVGNGTSSVRHNAFEIKTDTNSPLKKLDNTNIGINALIGEVSLDEIIKKLILDKFYPVGSIYTCTSETSSAAVCPIQANVGGTWERIEGRFLYACTGNTTFKAGNTGGSTEAIIVEHTHTANFNGTEGQSTDYATPTLEATLTCSVNTSENGEHSHTIDPTSLSGTITLRDKVGTGNIVKAASGICSVNNNGAEDKYALEDRTTADKNAPHTDIITIDASHAHTCVNSGKHTHSLNISMAPIEFKKDTGSHNHAYKAAGTVTVEKYGSSATNANMPPYLCVYMWKRVA